MRITSEVVPLVAAVKELHREILALRKDIDELRDEVKTMSSDNGIQFVLGGNEEEETDSDSNSSVESVQSAPATLSF